MKFIQLCGIKEINHKQEDKKNRKKKALLWLGKKKVTEWAEDQNKEIKEKEFEMEDMKTFQAKLILKCLVKFVSLKGLD